MNVSVHRPVLFIGTQVSLQKGGPACQENHNFNAHSSLDVTLYFIKKLNK